MKLPRRRKPQRMGLRQEPQVRCPQHRAWVRGHECLIAGRAGHVCEGKIEAAHWRLGNHAGIGQKPGDNQAIPLCAASHAEAHRIGEATFAKRYGVDPLKVAAELWRRSPHRRRYMEAS